MGCHGICKVVNDAICMGLCTASLERKRFEIESIGSENVLKHPALHQPIAVVSDETAARVRNLIE